MISSLRWVISIVVWKGGALAKLRNALKWGGLVVIVLAVSLPQYYKIKLNGLISLAAATVVRLQQANPRPADLQPISFPTFPP
jgi:hypothetical protein